MEEERRETEMPADEGKKPRCSGNVAEAALDVLGELLAVAIDVVIDAIT